MSRTLERLENLQQCFSERNDPGFADEDTEKVFFARVGNLFHVQFYGSPFDESYDDFLQLLSDREVAAELKSIVFSGPDEGANGTRNWDLTKLLDGGAEFPRLTSFTIESTALEHHNRTIVASDYDEGGQIARLLAMMPQVRCLAVPSAPNAEFFELGSRPLVSLRVDSGYDHQNFIYNLSQSSSFPNLRVLDFGDYNEMYMDDYLELCTPFEHYLGAFRSPAFRSIRVCRLRNPALSADQLKQLHSLRRDISLTVIRTESDFVR
ncbi:MAG: hypothetical protein M3Y56_00885 [Armatimonadota bacterium]|nr:hypothetical protein [Armatimonadota bacterium]